MTEPSSAALDFLKSFSDGTTDDVLPVSSRIAAEARQREEDLRNAHIEAIKNARPGDVIEGEGVYLGTYKRQALSKTFRVFAAPEDLSDAGGPLALNYNQALGHLFMLKNWHGHDGAGYHNDSVLYAALHAGGYNGEWIIPPRELLDGKILNSEQAQPDNLFAHKRQGAFKKSLDLDDRTNDRDLWYMSCTSWRNTEKYRWAINLANGTSDNASPSQTMRVRPIRLVEARLVPVIKGVTG